MISVLLIICIGISFGKATGCTNRYFSKNTETISSPNYPYAYDDNLDCDIYISVSSGHTVQITFVAFATETTHDWLQITCAAGTDFPSSQYSGSQIPADLTIPSCKLVKIQFHTDRSATNTGFSFTYTISSVCDNSYFSGTTGTIGTIKSPNHPNAYENYLDCYSYISVSPGNLVLIKFLAFTTEATHDWVEISCASGSSFTSPRHSGSQIPAVFTISACTLVNVRFHTDYSSVHSGFSLTYNVTSVCDIKYLSGPTETISSPNYPNAYTNTLDCYSYISVPPGHTVIITFLAFTTESGYDWLTISCTSGVTYASPRYSGLQIPPALTISSCSQVKVYFHTDGSTVYTGFNLKYNITSDCGNRNFSARTGAISSPNLPIAYSNYLDCSSYISVTPGNTIIITFLTINFESSRGWVTITCASGTAFAPSRYSGSQTPAVLTISSCNLIAVSFRTYGSATYAGFSLTYNVTSAGVIGGFTVKPSNAFPRSNTDEPVIFNCTTATKYLPWWTFNDKYSTGNLITTSICGVISLKYSSSWFKTETLGPGSCNLIVTAPAKDRYLLAGSFVCTDSTLSSARAVLVPINLELSSVTGTNSAATVTDIIGGEEMRISCNSSFTDHSSSPSHIYTYSPYSGGPLVRMRILRTYWTSEGSIVSGTDASSAASYVLVKAPKDGIIPLYTCNVVFDFFTNISDTTVNSTMEISISTKPVAVLYWPTEDSMTVIGENNGQIRTPALLYCSVAANPPATYTWIDESNGNVTNGPTIIVNHGGRYTCNASNIIRGQNYQQLKSVNVEVLEDEKPQLGLLVFILGVSLGVAVITIIALLVIVHRRKCFQKERNTDVGHDLYGNEHELRQRVGVSCNAYAEDPGDAVNVADSENEDDDNIYENYADGK